MELDFEWDAAKAESNLQKHGISFAAATAVFDVKAQRRRKPFSIPRDAAREQSPQTSMRDQAL